MRVMRTAVVLLGLVGTLAWAQAPESAPPPAAAAPTLPPPPPAETTSPASATVATAAPAAALVPEITPPSDHSVGVHLAVNLGLFAIDVHQGRFYGFASANLGVPLLTNGSFGAFALGLGASVPISSPAESMWYFDVYGMALPGWQDVYGSGGSSKSPFVGFGVGAGFRFLHRSGLVIGFKFPVFGLAAASNYNGYSYGGQVQTSQLVGLFFLSAIVAMPIVSFGYRF